MVYMVKNNVISKTHTATADTKFQIVEAPMWFSSLNIVCLTHPAYQGDRTEQAAPLFVNDVYYSENPVNLAEFFFKNYGAGNNCKVVAYGVLLLDAEKKRLGLPIDGT